METWGLILRLCSFILLKTQEACGLRRQDEDSSAPQGDRLGCASHSPWAGKLSLQSPVLQASHVGLTFTEGC